VKPRSLTFRRRLFPIVALGLLTLSAIACNLSRTAVTAGDSAAVFPIPTEILGAVPTVQPNTPLSQIQVTFVLPTLIPTAIATVFNEPQGCQRPTDDYTRQKVNGETLNTRTITMLRHAQELYGGTINFTGWAVTQGSYNPGGVSASFGTHDAGGAIDLSVRNPKNWAVLTDELPAAIQALRIAGFAAWVRESGELYANSPIHIHAIAIGDAELSPAAQDQLTGQFGYFRGFNGLPKDNGIPVADRHGGPVFCAWMLELGYRDLRQ
jgi:hypothetical protein